MARITTSVTVDAPPSAVWTDLRDIRSHVEWMRDAESIQVTSAEDEGVGTTFDCETVVGPIRITDRMVITDWDHERLMGVRHVGLVTGTGAFTLEDLGGERTRLTWTESLRFPWWMGGIVGAMAARPVMARIWRGNLARLKARVEHRGSD